MQCDITAEELFSWNTRLLSTKMKPRLCASWSRSLLSLIMATLDVNEKDNLDILNNSNNPPFVSKKMAAVHFTTIPCEPN